MKRIALTLLIAVVAASAVIALELSVPRPAAPTPGPEPGNLEEIIVRQVESPEARSASERRPFRPAGVWLPPKEKHWYSSFSVSTSKDKDR